MLKINSNGRYLNYPRNEYKENKIIFMNNYDTPAPPLADQLTIVDLMRPTRALS